MSILQATVMATVRDVETFLEDAGEFLFHRGYSGVVALEDNGLGEEDFTVCEVTIQYFKTPSHNTCASNTFCIM